MKQTGAKENVLLVLPTSRWEFRLPKIALVAAKRSCYLVLNPGGITIRLLASSIIETGLDVTTTGVGFTGGCLKHAAFPCDNTQQESTIQAGATTTPDPKTTVAFTCADAKDQPTGWCVTEVKSRFVHGLYNFAEANAVGPAKNLNYNCIGKPFAENSKPNVLNSFTSQDCQIKNFELIILI
ncbi:hypothetical protein H4Q26_016141 [Puccinia striiformis f. sp. tritici PST-130]|nr:hypothetical protein H4Q26_016141 [Puccinia striiformis f. sp. tritici PST-130]